MALAKELPDVVDAAHLERSADAVVGATEGPEVEGDFIADERTAAERGGEAAVALWCIR